MSVASDSQDRGPITEIEIVETVKKFMETASRPSPELVPIKAGDNVDLAYDVRNKYRMRIGHVAMRVSDSKWIARRGGKWSPLAFNNRTEAVEWVCSSKK